jgi:hypothetical protein
MQSTKDTFYISLRDRLASLNPLRTTTLNGTTRPAVVVAENEVVIPVKPQPDTFYLEWGTATPVPQQIGDRAIYAMECVISYHTFGSADSGVDRGRSLAALDTELLGISQPGTAPKCDYSKTPAANQGSSIVWSAPQFGKVAGSEAPRTESLPRGTAGVRLERTASVTVFFFPEAKF